MVDHLLKTDVKIHAITCTPDSAAAHYLKSLGVIITKGNLDNTDPLRRPVANCTTLFLDLMPALTDFNTSFEQTCRLLKTAKEAGIKLVFYASALSANDPRHLKSWDPTSIISTKMLDKSAIEDIFGKAGFKSWTILRPGSFLNNFLFPKTMMYQGFTETGALATAFAPETLLPIVAHNHIVQFAAAAVFDPVKFNHQDIEVDSEFWGSTP